MRGRVPHLGGLPSQPCLVTLLGGVTFLRVNAEGWVGWCLAGHLSISLNITICYNSGELFCRILLQNIQGNSFLEKNTIKHDSTSDSMVSDNQVDHTEAVFAMFSLAIDFLDEFGLERLTEPEKPLNEMSSDCK